MRARFAEGADVPARSRDQADRDPQSPPGQGPGQGWRGICLSLPSKREGTRMAETEPFFDTAEDAEAMAETQRARRLRLYAYLVGFMILLVGALDCFSTELALSTGAAMELNPVIRAFQDWAGPYWVAPKMLIHLILALTLVAAPSRAGLMAMTAVAVLTLGAALNNLAIFQSFMDKAL